MEFKNVLNKRHSIRSFKNKEIAEELVEEILSMANTSPSAGNLQARSVVIVKDKEIKKKLSQAAMDQDSVAQAGVIFVITANANESAGRYGKRGQELYCLQDATILAAYFQLAVTALGLASVWVGAFEESEVNNILDLDKGSLPIAIIPVGYPAGEPRNTDRKSLEELVIKRL